MYILATDFDRTFYINNSDLRKNIGASIKFMEKNMFIIATGRSYNDFQDLTKGTIKANYYVYNYGATIIKDDKELINYYIDDNLIDELKKIIDFDNLKYFACSRKESRVDINHENITKINVSFQDNLVAKKACDYINDNFNGKLNAYIPSHRNQIEIVSFKANKKNAIEYIMNRENIDKSCIFTVGDSVSDYEMIKNFNGYAMENANDSVKKAALKEVKSVSEIFEYLSIEIVDLNENDNIIEFVNKCFNHKNYFEKYMAKIYNHKDKLKYHVGIKKDNELIAAALLVPNKIYIDKNELAVLTVGSICVAKKYRNHGYLSLLMAYINTKSKKYDLSILSGDYSRYNFYGYYPNLLNIYKIPCNDNKYNFELLDDRYINESLDLYNNSIIHSNRTEDSFKEIAYQWKSEAYYIFKDKKFKGYLIYNTKHDYVTEMFTDKEFEVLENFALFKNMKYINFRVLNTDYVLNNKLSSYVNNKMYNRNLFKINNLEKVLDIFLNYKLKYSNLEKGLLNIKIGDKIIRIEVNDTATITSSDKYDIELTDEQFINILLNKKMNYNKLLYSWFYLDIDIFNNDLV